MSYARLNLMTELRLLSRGKPTHTPVEFIAEWALGHLRPTGMFAPKNDGVRFLEALYRLADTRQSGPPSR
jgi:hypothetical protein